MAHVDATFAGEHADASQGGASFCLRLGPDPSRGQVAIAGTGHSMRTGDLVFSDGADSVTISDLYVVERAEHDGPDGRYTTLVLKDRRWKWEKEAHVTGEWNKPEANGAVPDGQIKTARELVALCLEAMGESGYSVAALPDDFYPFASWTFEPAARAAQAVCDLCRCTLGLTSDGKARVYKLGTGATPPAGDREREDTGVRYTDEPDVYLVRGARKVIQRTSTLVPVALDTDGSVQPFDSVSYRTEVLLTYDSWLDAINNGFKKLKGIWPSIYRAAERSAGRWFRVPDAEVRYLPALGSICELVAEAGASRFRRPYVTSSELYLKSKSDGAIRPGVPGEVTASWSLDSATGVVKFRESPRSAEYEENLAPLKLVWAHESRQADGSLADGDFYTYTHGSGDSERVIEADWLVQRGVIADGGSEPAWQNTADLNTVAARLVELIKEDGETETSGAIAYAGIRDVWTDGAIRQVQWRVGQDGAGTSLAQNTDAPGLAGAALRVRLDALKRAAQSRWGAAAARSTALAGSAKPAAGALATGEDLVIEDMQTTSVVNRAGMEIPRYGALWLNRDGWETANYGVAAERPIQAGLTSVAIAANPIGWRDDADVSGKAKTDGCSPLLYVEREGCPVIAPKMRLGVMKHSFYAGYDRSGAWRVEGIIRAPAGEEPGQAFVRFVRRSA